MHPPRRKGSDPSASSIADRLTEWLFTHCPLSTLTLLTVLVSGLRSAFRGLADLRGRGRVGDLGINLIRWRAVEALGRTGTRSSARDCLMTNPAPTRATAANPNH